MGDPERSDPAGRRGLRQGGGEMSAGAGGEFAINPATVRAWKRYPAYKDSGVEWLGEVPAGWEVKRLKYLCQINPSKSEVASLPKDTKVSFLPMELIGEDCSLTLTENKPIDAVWEGYTYFRNGDIVVAKITPCFENGKGALCNNLTNGVAFGTTELHVLRAGEKINPKFLFLATKSYQFRKLGADLMTGTAGQKRVPDAFIRDYPVSVPPLPEQQAIAAFLDRETARLDALIAKKQRFIELLEEKRQALITQAVTKGLDPDAEMKDSGIERLGEVPAHWEVRAFTRCAIERADYRGATPAKTESGIFLVTAKNIRKGWIDYNASMEFVSETEYPIIMRRGLPRLGDLLLTTEAPLGYAALVDREDIALAQRVVRFRMDPSLFEPLFALYSVLSPYFQNQMRYRGTGSTVLGIKASKLPQLKILCPPVSEQWQILAFIEEKCATPGEILERAKRQITHLREYRTALISAAVTGNIDVRSEAPATP